MSATTPSPLTKLAATGPAARQITWRLTDPHQSLPLAGPLQGYDVSLEPGGILHLNGHATRQLLELLCLPRLSGVLTIELGGDVTGANHTTLRVLSPDNHVNAPHSVDNLQAWLDIGEQRWAALASQVPPGASLTHLDVQYSSWSRIGGGPDGSDPVYTLKLSLREPLSPVLEAPVQPQKAVNGGCFNRPRSSQFLNLKRGGTGVVESPGQAAAAFLATLAQPPMGQGRDTRGRDGRGDYSRSGDYRRRSRSRSRSAERHRHRHQRSYSRSPDRRDAARYDHSRDIHGPMRQSRPPQHAGAWAAGTACENPAVLHRLQRPAPTAPQNFSMKIGKLMHNEWVRINSFRYMHEAVLQSRFKAERRVRVVMVVHDSKGRVKKMIPTVFLEGRKLGRWQDIMRAMGGLRQGNFIVFRFIGTLKVEDSAFGESQVPFFVVEEHTSKPSDY